MVRLIETEEAAKRLARVILSDIELYNRQPGRSRADLEPELAEGYALFRKRVAPALVPLFSQVVAARWPSSPAQPAPRSEPGPRPGVVHSTRRDSLDPREAARRLARVMASSIQGFDRPDGGAGLAAEIEEARAQFQSCVIRELAPLFDEALAEQGLLEQELQPVEPVAAPPPLRLVSPYESTQTARGLVGATSRETTAPDDDDRSTIPVLPPTASRPPFRWLVVIATTVASATAGIVYLLLTG